MAQCAEAAYHPLLFLAVPLCPSWPRGEGQQVRGGDHGEVSQGYRGPCDWWPRGGDDHAGLLSGDPDVHKDGCTVTVKRRQKGPNGESSNEAEGTLALVMFSRCQFLTQAPKRRFTPGSYLCNDLCRQVPRWTAAEILPRSTNGEFFLSKVGYPTNLDTLW